MLVWQNQADEEGYHVPPMAVADRSLSEFAYLVVLIFDSIQHLTALPSIVVGLILDMHLHAFAHVTVVLQVDK